jgi:hypothetical protein
VGLLIAVAIAGVGVLSAREQAAPHSKTKASPMNATLDWTLTPGASSFHVEYKLTNHSDTTLWVADQMLEWKSGKLARAPDAIIVRNGRSADVASLFRGNVYIPTHDERMYPSPGMRAVAPRATITGTGEIARPIRAWHNYHPEKIEPLRPGIKRVQLEIQVLAHKGAEDKDWKYETLADGSRVESPFLRVLNQEGAVVSGDIKELP